MADVIAVGFDAILYLAFGGFLGLVVGLLLAFSLVRPKPGPDDGSWVLQLLIIIAATLSGAGMGLYSALKTGGVF